MAAPASDIPRIRVAALVTLDNRIVLVRHRRDSSVYHLLPGGGVDYGETLQDALIREVSEETGLRVRLGKLLFVNDTIDPSGARHVVNITFAAEILGGQITDHPSDSRIEAVELVAPDALASLDLRPPMADALQRVLAGEDSEPGYLGSLFSAGR